MAGLRILITNYALNNRGGSELYVRDLARALLACGHCPLVFSPVLGSVAEEIRKTGIPVSDDLGKINQQPDLIHGHHHVPTMLALLHFSGVPAIFVCHGWVPWEEQPPLFPRIRRYVAVSALCRERLISEHGISPEIVHLVPSFVDLERFAACLPLPTSARKTLLFGNYHREPSEDVETMRQACQGVGLSLDLVGVNFGNSSAAPESLFARLRCGLRHRPLCP